VDTDLTTATVTVACARWLMQIPWRVGTLLGIVTARVAVPGRFLNVEEGQEGARTLRWRAKRRGRHSSPAAR